MSCLTHLGNRPDANFFFGNDDKVTRHARFNERPESLQPLSIFHCESPQENSGRGLAPQVHELTEILVIGDQNAVLSPSALGDLCLPRCIPGPPT